MTTVEMAAVLCDVTANPRGNEPVRFGTEIDEPARVFHVVAFAEVADAYVVPLRVTRR
jgi:hypothetical protein